MQFSYARTRTHRDNSTESVAYTIKVERTKGNASPSSQPILDAEVVDESPAITPPPTAGALPSSDKIPLCGPGFLLDGEVVDDGRSTSVGGSRLTDSLPLFTSDHDAALGSLKALSERINPATEAMFPAAQLPQQLPTDCVGLEPSRSPSMRADLEFHRTEAKTPTTDFLNTTISGLNWTVRETTFRTYRP